MDSANKKTCCIYQASLLALQVEEADAFSRHGLKTTFNHMSTPAKAFVSHAKIILGSFVCFWLFACITSRVWALHEAFMEESQGRKDDQWLLDECSRPEFYSRMKRHAEVCNRVQAHARTSIWLYSLKVMADSTHLCGSRPCVDFFHTIISKGGWQVLALCLGIVMFLPNLLYAATSVWYCRSRDGMRMSLLNRQSKSLPALTNAPFLHDAALLTIHEEMDGFTDLQLRAGRFN